MKSSKCVVSVIGVLLILPSFAPARPQPIGNLACAEEQEQAPAQARKFDEYEINRASIGDMKARLDGFYEELQKQPSPQAYIFIYGSKRAAPRYRSVAIRDYLKLRGLAPARLKIIRGGSRNEPMIEFWVVPKGAQPPKATPPYQATRRRKR